MRNRENRKCLILACWFCLWRFDSVDFSSKISIIFRAPPSTHRRNFAGWRRKTLAAKKFLWWNWEKYLNKAEFVNIYNMSHLISGILSTFSGLNFSYFQNRKIKVRLQSLKFYWFEANLLLWSESFLSNLLKIIFAKLDLSFRTAIF